MGKKKRHESQENTYDSEYKKLLSKRELFADFNYDLGMIFLDQFNAYPPPVFSGYYLEFDTEQELEAFIATIPPRERSSYGFFFMAGEEYKKCLSDAESAGETDAAFQYAMKLCNALSKTEPSESRPYAALALKLARETGNSEYIGRALMGEAWNARYLDYDGETAWNLIIDAQSEFEKIGSRSQLFSALLAELEVLSPTCGDGKLADLDRTIEICSRCAELAKEMGNWNNLVDVYLREYREYLDHQRPDLIEKPLRKLLAVIKEHFPDQYERNLQAVDEILEENGVVAAC